MINNLLMIMQITGFIAIVSKQQSQMWKKKWSPHFNDTDLLKMLIYKLLIIK